jgi:hypothetical protein
MVINRRRKRRTGRMPAALKRYWAAKRNDPDPAKRRVRRHRRGAAVRVRHVYANPRSRRRVQHSGGGGIPSSLAGFVSMKFLVDAAFVAGGAVVPALVTDRLLPMVGFAVSGWTRRILQLAVPAVVILLGGKRMLGTGALPFVLGAAGFTILGVVNDVTGGVAAVGRYSLPSAAVGGHAVGVGRYQAMPAALRG